MRAAITEALRDVAIQMGRLNHTVGGHVALNGLDLECLDLIARRGPLGPGALAELAGLHPATMTGILDRLERQGWIAREPDAVDRRRVVVRALRDRGPQLVQLYSGMARSMNELLGGYDERELDLILDFLTRTAENGRTATAALNPRRRAGDGAA